MKVADAQTQSRVHLSNEVMAVIAEELSRQHTESVQQLSQKVRVVVNMNIVLHSVVQRSTVSYLSTLSSSFYSSFLNSSLSYDYFLSFLAYLILLSNILQYFLCSVLHFFFLTSSSTHVSFSA